MDPGNVLGIICIGGFLIGVIPAAIMIDRWSKQQREKAEAEDAAWRQEWIDALANAEHLASSGMISSAQYEMAVMELKTEWELRYGRNYGPLAGLIALDLLLD